MDKECQNCAYAVYRDKPEKFNWLEYECTCEEVKKESHLPPYRYKNQSCSHFLATEKNRT